MSHLTQVQTTASIIAELKAIAPSQFDKKFSGLDLAQIRYAFDKACFGLDPNQIKTGFETIWQKGFIPDPVLFRQWCLGNTDFKLSDEIADSYIGKHGALADIIKWMNDPNTPISQAMKQAYDDTYHLWQYIVSEADKTKAELAFKDRYVIIVDGLVKDRIKCQAYVQPVLLTDDKPIIKKPIADKETAMAFLAKLKPALAKAVV